MNITIIWWNFPTDLGPANMWGTIKSSTVGRLTITMWGCTGCVRKMVWMEEILHQLIDGLSHDLYLFIGFQPSKVVQDFFHPHYVSFWRSCDKIDRTGKKKQSIDRWWMWEMSRFGILQAIYGYGSIPINTIFSGMNIHLPAILMFTRGIRFWHTAIWGYTST